MVHACNVYDHTCLCVDILSLPKNQVSLCFFVGVYNAGQCLVGIVSPFTEEYYFLELELALCFLSLFINPEDGDSIFLQNGILVLDCIGITS
jgi:hypothetical protein